MEEHKDKLWREYCIQGNEHNPTDTMYYEQFMLAVDKAYQAGIQDGREETVKDLWKEILATDNSRGYRSVAIIDLFIKYAKSQGIVLSSKE